MANKIVPQTLNSSGVYDKLITAISSGGTGAESESAAVKNLISGLTSTSPVSDDLIPFQDVSSGGAGKTTLSALASALQSVRGYAKIQTGSYVGTGTYGADNPCSLTFESKPSIITIGVTGSYMPASSIPRYAIFYVFNTTTEYGNKGTVITGEAVPIGDEYVAMYSCFKNNAFMWYSDKNHYCQLNYNSLEYCYLAIFN